jgi:hypothetical protein
MESKKITVTASAVISDVNQVAMDWARDHAGELLGTKWYDGETGAGPSEKWPVSEPVRLAIRKIMTDAFSRLVPMKELVESIRKAGGFPIERAKLIAETEIKFAQSRGNLEAWIKTGVVQSVQSILSMLHVDEDECDLNAEAGPIPIGQLFPSGDVAPPFHIHCRCTLSICEIKEKRRSNTERP